MKIFDNLKWNLKTGEMNSPIAYVGKMVYAGGGSESTNETVPTGPWEAQIPSILNLFSEAQNLYNQGPPQAFEGVNGNLTPDINTNIASTQNAVGGLTGGNIDQNQQIQQMLMQLAGGQTAGQQFGDSFQGGIS